MDNLQKEIKEIIGEVCAVEPEKIDINADIYEKLGVDSMMAVKILASIDVRYNIEIPTGHAQKIRTVNELVGIVQDLVKINT